jgi:uncharacterized protein YbjT (DUF2867 family)
MTEILVTGGTGVLGRRIVRRLAGAADVRVLSRGGGEIAGARVFHGDLETGEGLSSIVGVDAIPYGYYRAKFAVEKMVEESGLPWTILRATQFHELVVMMLSLLAKAPVAVVPRGVKVQPVDAGEVADRLVELALGAPAGRAPDMGGPRVERTEDLMRAYLRAVRRRRPVVRLPIPGRTMAAYRAGQHLTPAGATGVRGFAEDLRDRIGPDGTLPPPYDLRHR